WLPSGPARHRLIDGRCVARALSETEGIARRRRGISVVGSARRGAGGLERPEGGLELIAGLGWSHLRCGLTQRPREGHEGAGRQVEGDRSDVEVDRAAVAGVDGGDRRDGDPLRAVMMVCVAHEGVSWVGRRLARRARTAARKNGSDGWGSGTPRAVAQPPRLSPLGAGETGDDGSRGSGSSTGSGGSGSAPSRYGVSTLL